MGKEGQKSNLKNQPQDKGKNNKESPSNKSVTPDSLIGTAAAESGGEPAPIDNAAAPPVANQQPPNGGPMPASDDSNMGQELMDLMQADPALARKIADVIEQHYSSNTEGGNQSMNEQGNQGSPMPGMEGNPAATAPAGGAAPAGAMGPVSAPAAPISQAPAMGPAQGAPEMSGAQQQMNIPPELINRLQNVERGQAQMSLDRELAEAKNDYQQIKEQLPILPDLNDKELLQVSYNKGGMPLKDALIYWAWNKLQEGSGEGTLADRIIAQKMNQSHTGGLPKVEGKGGGIPSGAEAPPESMKEARQRAKNEIFARFAQPNQ